MKIWDFGQLTKQEIWMLTFALVKCDVHNIITG